MYGNKHTVRTSHLNTINFNQDRPAKKSKRASRKSRIVVGLAVALAVLAVLVLVAVLLSLYLVNKKTEDTDTSKLDFMLIIFIIICNT